MTKPFTCTLLLTATLAGCAQPQPPCRPTPELQRLERFVGEWTDCATLIVPEGEEPVVFNGGQTANWALAGKFVRADGWHDLGHGQTMHYTDYITWDPPTQQYRGWFFSDLGQYGETWWTEDGDRWRIRVETHNADGAKSVGEGTLRFLDDDTLEKTWSETGPQGSMKFRSLSKRVR